MAIKCELKTILSPQLHQEKQYEEWIGPQPWVLEFSITGCGIDIILSLNTPQECIHSSIIVEKIDTNENISRMRYSLVFHLEYFKVFRIQVPKCKQI
jgi:hypothetical protein